MRNISFEGQFQALSEGKPAIQEEYRNLLSGEIDVNVVDINNMLTDNRRGRVNTGGMPSDFI